MKLKTVAMTGVLSLAGLGLIGVGAHAAFTTTTTSSQTISAGTLSVVTWSADATNGCTLESDGCTSVTLPVQNVASVFDTTASKVYIENTGTLPVTESAMQLTASTNGTAGNYLEDEMNVCIASDPGSGGTGAGGETVSANGPLTTGLGLSPSVVLVGPQLATGATDEYNMEFYAGENSVTCGPTWSDGGHTASAWSGAPYPTVYPWVTPASLTNAAEGGSVNVTLTLTETDSSDCQPEGTVCK
jgi:predicted ribosomally synthesized peptide with SipW-like signal peptide